jgi:hypothetical protein
MTVWVVWSRDLRGWDGEIVPYGDPITYRDWATALRDVRAALAHGRQVRISKKQIARAVWDKHAPPSATHLRTLRGTAT